MTTMVETARPERALRDVLSLVKFSHSIFALPFALAGAWLAASGVP
jgi:4-hydroxybenzoate polyprenyltransferase